MITRKLFVLLSLLVAFAADMQAGDGRTPESPIDITNARGLDIPLTISDDYPFLPMPFYLALDASQNGRARLAFAPSITEIKLRRPGESGFRNIEHSYIRDEYGMLQGSESVVPISAGEHLEFIVTGFNPVKLTVTEEDPVPGTMADFPLPAGQGILVMPAEDKDFYWTFTPDEEGYAELNSDISLPGGYVEIMMNPDGFGSFMIQGELSLRCHVWDRMPYIIHLHRAVAGEPLEFGFRIGPVSDVDEFYPAQALLPEETAETLPYAGTYHYRILSPDLIGSTLKLTTLDTPYDERTRVNLYRGDDPSETLARGLDLEYEVEPKTEYVIVYTLFDNRHPLRFNVSFEGGESGVRIPNAGDAREVRAFDLSGKPVGNTTPKGIIIKDGKKIKI